MTDHRKQKKDVPSWALRGSSSPPKTKKKGKTGQGSKDM